MTKRVLVTGASGFIGRHLVRRLKESGYWVRAVDLSPQEYGQDSCSQVTALADEFALLDLRMVEHALHAARHIDQIYALAYETGGARSEAAFSAQSVNASIQIDLNTLESALANGVERVLYTSSTSVYPEYLQGTSGCMPLREDDALPARPLSLSGWQKLFSEMLFRQYRLEHNLQTMIARLPLVYGPECDSLAGQESAPSSLCHKVGRAKSAGVRRIELHGDSAQECSLLYVSDCVDGLVRLMESAAGEVMNFCDGRVVSLAQLLQHVSQVAGWPVEITPAAKPAAGQGICVDNTRARRSLGWEPHVNIDEGLALTYTWIEKQLVASVY